MVWEQAGLVLQVKEPLVAEFEQMRPAQVLFTYLHLAASRALTEQLLARRVVAIAYETVRDVAAAGTDVRGRRALLHSGRRHIPDVECR